MSRTIHSIINSKSEFSFGEVDATPKNGLYPTEQRQITSTGIESALTYSILTGGFRVGRVNGHASANGQAWVPNPCCIALMLVMLGNWNILHELR